MAAKATKKTKTRTQKTAAKTASKAKTKTKAAAKKTATKKAAPKKAKKAAAKPKTKPAAKKTATKKAAPKKAAKAKPAAKKAAVKKAAPKKAATKKTAAKKAAPKAAAKKAAPKAAAKKAAPKAAPKTAAKKAAAKKTTAKAAAKKPAAKLTEAAKPAAKPKPRTKPIIARPARPERVEPASIRPSQKHEPKVTATPDPRPSKLDFKPKEHVVYPAHGVGRITSVERQEVAGHELELYVITFDKDKMTLRVPTNKSDAVGLRKVSEPKVIAEAINTLKGKAKVKRTMWSRRAQEYEAKINSGDLIAISEVVRDLYRSDKQPEQSYSERQLYEAAIDRMAREVAAAENMDDTAAIGRLENVLSTAAGKAEKKAEESAE